MLKKTEAEAALKKCRGLIDEIIAGLSAEKPLVNISSVAELLFYLEFAASALKSPQHARKRRETKIVTVNYQRHLGRVSTSFEPLTAKRRG
jgi:hypothetical protein